MNYKDKVEELNERAKTAETLINGKGSLFAAKLVVKDIKVALGEIRELKRHNKDQALNALETSFENINKSARAWRDELYQQVGREDSAGSYVVQGPAAPNVRGLAEWAGSSSVKNFVWSRPRSTDSFVNQGPDTSNVRGLAEWAESSSAKNFVWPRPRSTDSFVERPSSSSRNGHQSSAPAAVALQNFSSQNPGTRQQQESCRVRFR
jgi:hypothetical protein